MRKSHTPTFKTQVVRELLKEELAVGHQRLVQIVCQRAETLDTTALGAYLVLNESSPGFSWTACCPQCIAFGRIELFRSEMFSKTMLIAARYEEMVLALLKLYSISKSQTAFP